MALLLKLNGQTGTLYKSVQDIFSDCIKDVDFRMKAWGDLLCNG